VLPMQARRHGIDVLFSAGYTAPAILPCRSVVAIYDLSFLRHPEDFSWLSALALRALVPMAARRADRIVTLSQASMREIVAELGIPEKKVRVIYPAAGECESGPNGGILNDVRGRHGLRGRSILTVAASHPHKNLCRLVEAYSSLREEGLIEHQLVLAGLKGRDHPRLTSLIRQLSLEGEVIVTGWIPERDLASLYAAADLFVLPSLFEGFGIPALEAMSHGIPTVLSNAPALVELAGDAAIIVDPYKVGEIAAGIRRALADPKLRKILIQRGYKRAENFSWPDAAGQTLSVCVEVMNSC